MIDIKTLRIATQAKVTIPLQKTSVFSRNMPSEMKKLRTMVQYTLRLVLIIHSKTTR